jgi:acyl-CoA synthetase (AMP-forming)/AMP-acid ligase II
MFISMLDELENNKSKYDLRSLRTGLISGATVPEALMRRIIAEMGP